MGVLELVNEAFELAASTPILEVLGMEKEEVELPQRMLWYPDEESGVHRRTLDLLVARVTDPLRSMKRVPARQERRSPRVRVQTVGMHRGVGERVERVTTVSDEVAETDTGSVRSVCQELVCRSCTCSIFQ